MPKKASRSARSSSKSSLPEMSDTYITETIVKEEEPVSANYQFSLPRNYTPFYVLLLVVISFLLGALTAKSQYLEKTGINNMAMGGAQQPAAAGTQGQQAAQPATPPAKVTLSNGHFPILGQASAKVTLIEFADPRCPFCKSFHDDTLPQITTDYINTGKVKMYWRQYPFLGPASVTAANALECANDQGHFWDLEDYLYKNQPSESDTSMFTTANLAQIAGTLGMDTNQFQSCLSATTDQKNITADMADAQKAGVNGTPTFFVNGTPLVGAQPYSAFKTLIDQELAK